ncbi:Bifunctional inhibitor/lipid-transfer protein/seed storage 2S albumin superfamily protein [Raphanus sativus]|nr:Bifunctional inhibitor/lipid-transfer protein/seed storage 2S albumin superfamily protein [Raphanus sativus]
MGKKSTRCLITVLAMVLTATMMIQEAKSIPLCKVNTNDLQKCRPAVTGNYPPPPTPACCTVAKTANLECLCPFLSRSGIDPSKLKPLFAKCGVNNPSCLPWSVKIKVPLTILETGLDKERKS